MTGQPPSDAVTVGLRRPTQRFARAGWRLDVVDMDQLLAQAETGSVDVMVDPPLAPPVGVLRMSLTGTAGGLQLEATLHRRRGLPQPYFTAVGGGPIGTLLKRGVDAGDERAVRIVAGLQTAADRLNRLSSSGSPRPPTPGPRLPRTRESRSTGSGHRSERVVDAQTGLETIVTLTPRTGRIRSARLQARGTRVTALELAAFFDAVTQVVRRMGGDVTGDFVLAAAPIRSGGVSLEQVGGLDDVVAAFRDIAVSFRHPEAMARWGARRPQGILLSGPPGTGKTMLARALAAEIGATLREIRTPDIHDKWLGASERNLRRIFAEARQYRTPTVLLFDEFDSIIGYATAGGDSGSHAINAVAGLFKQEMNNLIEHNPNVIVIATTNFPDAIDASLVRSGRFDVKLEIPRPDAAARVQILTRMMRELIAGLERDSFRLFADDIDLDDLAARTDGMVGADLREILRRAQLAKATQEARTGRPGGPIRQADILEIVGELRSA